MTMVGWHEGHVQPIAIAWSDYWGNANGLVSIPRRMLGHVGLSFFAIMWKQLCHKNGKSSCFKGAFTFGVNDSSIKSSNTKLVI